jgi:hypothetical protein
MNRKGCGRKWSWPNLRYPGSIYGGFMSSLTVVVFRDENVKNIELSKHFGNQI